MDGPISKIPPNTAASAAIATPTKILGFITLANSFDFLNVEIVIIPLGGRKIMQYFQAVQQGKQRAGKSQMRMFEAAGFGMLTLTTKKVDGKFQPVGDEDFTAVVKSDEGHVAIIVDKDGYTKTQSKALEKDEALAIYKKLRDSGVEEYPGKEILIWTETRPTIQNES